jgi:acetoin utilization deacetylase AcuC-like enzyme
MTMVRIRKAFVSATMALLLKQSRGFASTANRCARLFGQRRGRSVSSAASVDASAEELISSGEEAEPTAAPRQRPSFTIYYNDIYEVKLPPNHRFPMEKYRKVRKRVQQMIQDLPEEERGLVDCEFRPSPLATFEELTTTHSPDYVRRFFRGDLSEEEIRNVGFPWSDAGVKRATSSVGGTVAAACTVCDEWRNNHNCLPSAPPPPPWGAHVAGGTHHAFYDYGEGFCVFSDIAVAANVVLQRFPHKIRRILILDLDVHQGNGNAALFRDRPEVFTFSMHCSANYFSPKESSDLDVELPVDCDDVTYLSTFRHWLNRIKREADEKFDLIFFQAGVDILHHDRLGRMAITPAGVKRRNEFVFDFAQDLNVPLVITMGGGYPRSDWTPVLDAHANVYFQAHQFLSSKRTRQDD